MKEIGLKLKEKREENGISIEEVADDLKVRPNQILSLESGNKDDFKDVLTLKYLIRDYGKYLGFDENELVDEFNEFLFDFTSKIPVEEIEKSKNDVTLGKEFSSPYTKKFKNKNHIKVVIGIFVLIIIFVITYFILSNVKHNDFQCNNVTYVIRRSK